MAPHHHPHFGTVENPIAMMEHEHDAEGERFRRIAELSSDYTNPPDGCTTYGTAYAMLREFEEDLHRHSPGEQHLFPEGQGPGTGTAPCHRLSDTPS